MPLHEMGLRHVVLAVVLAYIMKRLLCSIRDIILLYRRVSEQPN